LLIDRPPNRAGLFDPSGRIRQSSVELLGDLLYRITGVKAVGLSDIDADTGNQDAEFDIYGSGSALSTLSRVLGKHRRDDVMSSVYMLLCDSSGVVRQSALQVCGKLSAGSDRVLAHLCRLV
jgi:hypothetical protein